MDPLDGTINYANGIPYFCVSVGLVVDGRPAVGAVCDPMRGETYWATADGPAMLGDRIVHASAKDKLTDFVISLSLGGRAVATRGARGPAGGAGVAQHGIGGARPRLCRERPVRRVPPVGRHVRLGRRGGRADRGARRGRR